MPEAARTTQQELAALENMTTGELRERYEEVFGEAARSNNRRWLQRRVAWRIQMLAEGDLAARTVDRVRDKTMALARDADLRVRPPIAPDDNGGPERMVSGPLPAGRDERVPPPGAVLVREFKGREHRVTVRANGFEYRGDLPPVTVGRDPVTEPDIREIAAELDWGRQREQWAEIVGTPGFAR